MFWILTQEDKTIIKNVITKNSDEVNLWRIPNLIIPVIIIVITIIIYTFFQPWEDVKIEGVLGFLVNGSLPLIAVNQIAGVGIYIFKFNKTQEKELGIDTTRRIRTHLFYQVFCVILFSTITYAYQTIFTPFTDFYQIGLVFLASVILVWCSFCVSRKIYILQEDFINMAYDAPIRDVVTTTITKQNWDNYE